MPRAKWEGFADNPGWHAACCRTPMRYSAVLSSTLMAFALAACGGSDKPAQDASEHSADSADKANDAANKAADKADQAADKANDAANSADKAEKENDSK